MHILTICLHHGYIFNIEQKKKIKTETKDP